MKLSTQGLYRPARLGIPMPQAPRLGVSMSFPNITVSQEDKNSITGFVPQTAKDGIVLSLGGAGLSYASKFLPGMAETVAIFGGIGLIGFGVYKIYEAVSGNGLPSVESIKLSPGQKITDVSLLTGKILEPSSGGQAELSSKWTAVFESKRTFKVKFAVTNSSKEQTIQTIVEFRTQQVSRPLVGESEISNFSTSYLLELGPEETKIVPGFQPVKALESFLDVQSYRSQDITASLVAHMSANDSGKKLDQITFTAW